jgi:endothelin-converting enzyme
VTSSLCAPCPQEPPQTRVSPSIVFHDDANPLVETAPLLDPTGEGIPADAHTHGHHRNPFTRPSRGLTLLEKILTALAILLLLLATTFIGLFAGTKHRLDKEHQKQPIRVTSTASATRTIIATTTAGGQRPFPPAPTSTGKPGHGHEHGPETCLTRECVLLASNILQSLDETVDPCQDFYSFASESSLRDPRGGLR